MNSKIIIGIPIHSFDNPMSRLSESVDLKTRQSLQKALLVNTVNCFKGKNVDIFLISNSRDVEVIADELNVNLFKANVSGLNNEIIKFTNQIKNYQNWTICHADLPYLNKFNISVFLNEIENNKVITSEQFYLNAHKIFSSADTDLDLKLSKVEIMNFRRKKDIERAERDFNKIAITNNSESKNC